jgi:hypothetical protein
MLLQNLTDDKLQEHDNKERLKQVVDSLVHANGPASPESFE